MNGRIGLLLALAAALAFAAPSAAQTSTRGGARSTVTLTGTVPAWSPDGKQIAFADLVGSSWAVLVVDADGGTRHKIVDVGRDRPKAISWSPDGARLAYDAFDGDDERTDVFTVAVTGGRPTKVTSGWAPSWGTGNTLLVVDRGAERGDDQTFVVGADGKGKRQLEPCPEAEFGGCSDGNPDWSPDGTRVAFDTVQGAGGAIWLMSPDGTNRRIITPFFPGAARPRWSPDGATILYQHFDVANAAAGDLSVMNADGSASRVVTKNGEFPDWSPDGKTIVFARAASQNENLYLVNADGSNERPLTGPSGPPAPAAKCVVPKVVGKTLAAAKALVAKAQCTVGKITRAASRTIAKGRVVSSKPKAGTTAPPGTAVALVVSRGRR